MPLDPKVAAFGGAARGVREAWGLEAREETAVPPALPVPRRVVAGIIALVLVALALVAVLVLQRTARDPLERPLDETGFGSAALAAALMPYDANGNGRLSPSEAASVTELDCSNRGLRAVDGLNALVNLESLDLSGNALSSLDVSGLDHLVNLDVSDNAIVELDLSGSAALVQLDAGDNGMTALGLAGCTALQSLHCPGNAIARLDLGDCTSLTDLVCDPGQNVTVPIAEGFFPDAGLRAALAAGDVDGNGALTQRERQALTSLTVSDPSTASLFGLAWLPNLTELDASGCALTALNANELPRGLVTLRAAGCQIAQVNLAGLDRLATLDLSLNPMLTSVDLSGQARLANLNLAGCALEGTLNLTSNPNLQQLDVTSNPNLAAVDITGVSALQTAGAILCDPTCTVVLEAAPLEDPALAATDSEQAGEEAPVADPAA